MARDEEEAFDCLSYGRQVLRSEAAALDALSDTLGPSFLTAVDALLAAKSKIIVTGMGKSGHIASKIAATLASTGSPAFFLHPAEAAHGDLGMIGPDDVLIMLSNSGESSELLCVANHGRQMGLVMIVITANVESRLGRLATIPLPLLNIAEACPHNVAPSTSTTMALALGDALALTAMKLRGFQRSDFAKLHPGGKIGLRLTKVQELMLTGGDLPLVDSHADSHATIMEMTGKRLGTTGVVDNEGRLVGVITDGDLRRSFSRSPGWKAEDIMSPKPITVGEEMAADEALALMHSQEITILFVIDASTQRPRGVIHMHHFVELGL